MSGVPVLRGMALALLLGLLSACGSTPEKPSARQAKAVEYNQRAQSAFQRGEYVTAIQFYEWALKLDSSIENVEGIAVNLVNLAKVHRVLGQAEESQRYLDRLLNEKTLSYGKPHLAAAAVQKALWALQARDAKAAAGWVEKAAEYCADCTLSGVVDGLRANIALMEGDAEKAVYWSDRAASANKKLSPLEYANALRLSAQARMLRREYEAAIPLLQEALALDKSQGLPEKIRIDLMLLADCHEKKGAVELAGQYRERAARVSAAAVK